MNQPAKEKLTITPATETKAPLPGSHEYTDYCRSSERIAKLSKELDKYMAPIKAKIFDASYRIDLNDNCIYFNGGPEKQVCTTLIQPDSAITKQFQQKRLYSSRAYIAPKEDKLEKLAAKLDEDKIDRLLAMLDKEDAGTSKQSG